MSEPFMLSAAGWQRITTFVDAHYRLIVADDAGVWARLTELVRLSPRRYAALAEYSGAATKPLGADEYPDIPTEVVTYARSRAMYLDSLPPASLGTINF